MSESGGRFSIFFKFRLFASDVHSVVAAAGSVESTLFDLKGGPNLPSGETGNSVCGSVMTKNVGKWDTAFFPGEERGNSPIKSLDESLAVGIGRTFFKCVQ